VFHLEKRRDIRNFYVDQNFIPIYEKFKKIVEAERKSVSDKIRELLTEYVRLHEPGNPQQRLDTIFRIGHAYRAEGCCACAKPADVQAFTKEGLNLLYCWECFEKTGRIKAAGWREYKRKRGSKGA
jgi:hypothetical protein